MSETRIVITSDHSRAVMGLRETGAAVARLESGVKSAGTGIVRGLAGVRDTVLSLTGAMAALGLSVGLGRFIRDASDLEEVTSKFGVVFDGQIEKAREWADALYKAYGLSTREARQYLSSIQDLLVPMGMQADVAGRMSFAITKLAVDLGSFNNRETALVMDDITAALTGSLETMKKYGVTLSAANVEQQALAMGLASSKKELSQAHKAFAAYTLIVQGSQAAIGDYSRTSAGFANQQRLLRRNFEELSVTIGNELLPAATDIITRTNELLKANDGLIKQKVPEYIDGLRDSIRGVIDLYNDIPDAAVSGGAAGLIGLYLFGRLGVPAGPAAVVAGILGVSRALQKFREDNGWAFNEGQGVNPLRGEISTIPGREKTGGAYLPPGAIKADNEGGRLLGMDLLSAHGGPGIGGPSLLSAHGGDLLGGSVVTGLGTADDMADVAAKLGMPAPDVAETYYQDFLKLRGEIWEEAIKQDDERMEAMRKMLEEEEAVNDQILESERRRNEEKDRMRKDDQRKSLSSIRGLLEATSSGSKTMFQIWKVYRMAEAGMELVAGVSKTFNAWPYPWNIPMAAAHAALGATYISQLAASSFGGTTSPLSPGSASSPSIDSQLGRNLGASKGGEPSRTVNITIHAAYVDRDTIARDLVPSITKAIADGVR